MYGPNEEADEYNRDEYNGFLKMGCKIAGIEIETLGQVSVEEVVATMLAEDREAARATPVPPKRGRPPTPHRHLWITVSIEAYRGMGLRRKAAEIRAAREWDLHPSTIGKIYKVNKELKPISKEMRALFNRDFEGRDRRGDPAIPRERAQPRINTPLFEINTPFVPFGIAPNHY